MPKQLLDEASVFPAYRTLAHQKRRAVLRDTVEKFSQEDAAKRYTQQARNNLQEWKSAQAVLPNRVRVLSGDWGDVTRDLSKASGKVYAVLNMANAYGPGGGYLEGMVAQEENMYRRTDCHFYIYDDEMDKNKRLYTPEMSALINGAFGRVYLDAQHPRVCIKGSESANGSGYDDLPAKEYFLFYELKSAADDLRDGRSFNETSMRKKIVAQLETLKEKNIRHVVLSAFGCGAFANPADQVARIYRKELEKRNGDFDDVVFAIYHAGYGANNFAPFKKALDGLPLNKVPLSNTVELLSTLKDNVNQKVWDQRGFVFLFFDFRKTPTGIVQIRNVLNSDIDEYSKIRQLKKIAQERLASPPLFTSRDDKVQALYQNIMKIDVSTVDSDLINQFKSENEFQLGSP